MSALQAQVGQQQSAAASAVVANHPDDGAAAAAVPTLPSQVREKLRSLGEPVRLFGENLMNVRERLRQTILLVANEEQEGTASSSIKEQQQQLQQQQQQQQTTTQYTRASAALVEARQGMCQYSLTKAKQRLERERILRRIAQTTATTTTNKKQKPNNNNDNDTMSLDDINESCRRIYQSSKKLALEASQYGDRRALSALSCTNYCHNNNSVPIIVTASWTSNMHVWNSSTTAAGGLNKDGADEAETTAPDRLPPLSNIGLKTQCHEDRIVGLDVLASTSGNGKVMIVTTSLDKTAKLWTLEEKDAAASATASEAPESAHTTSMSTDEKHDGGGDEDNSNHLLFSVDEQHCLKGHSARTCRASIYPDNGKYVATTSADHSWRLWDTNTGKCLLLQDGHADTVYGCNFHPDGSIVATCDFSSVVHLWDLRSGQSCWRSIGQHAGRVLNCVFNPTIAFQLATAGDDGTIQIFDIRRTSSKNQKRRQQHNNNTSSSSAVSSIPAHNNLITNLRYDSSGEVLGSSSFDGTVKLWSCRNNTWKLLNELHGHQGKVTSVDFVQPQQLHCSVLRQNNSNAGSCRSEFGVVTCGFDKTLKLWDATI